MSEIQIDAAEGIVYAARFAGGRMTDLLADSLSAPDQTGAVLLGRVDRVDRAGDAAFLDLGAGPHGHLAGSTAGLAAGRLELVQVTTEAEPPKGLGLTRDIALPGRFLVRLPRSGRVALSRLLDPAEKAAWQSRLGPGWIVRAAAAQAPVDQVMAEAAALERDWQAIADRAAGRDTPGLLRPALPVALRLALDHPDADRLRVAPAARFAAGLDALERAVPGLGPATCEACDILDALPSLRAAAVALPGGGSLLIEPGLTLTAIDVNAGAGRDGTAANLEAATETARQVRLRNLGGLIVVDFIGMKREADRRAVMERLRTALAADPATIRLTPLLSPLGLAEFARQRRGRALHRVLPSGPGIGTPAVQSDGNAR